MKILPVVALNASTFVAITVPVNAGAKTFLLQCSGAIDVSLANDVAGTDVFTLKSGGVLAFEIVPAAAGVATTFTLCWAKAASSTPNMQILQLD